MSSDAASIKTQFNINQIKLDDEKVYKFDRFRLDAALLLIYENKTLVELAPKVVETLLALVERSGEIVSKKELMDRLWADSFVDEANLTQNIYLLRKTLGKTEDGRDLIETFRRRGYRFNGEVKSVAEFAPVETNSTARQIAEVDLPTAKENSGRLPTVTFSNRTKVYLFGAVALAAILFGGFGWSRFAYRQNAAAFQFQNVSFKRLTPDQHAYNPAISPDGKYLAYALIENSQSSLWLKDIAVGATIQILPPTAGGYKGLQFSPDGKWIYFLTQRKNVPNQIIARVPMSGGAAQELIRDVVSPPAVSPDGRRVAFIRGVGLWIADAEDGGDERLIIERGGAGRAFIAWDSQMSWSPDGTRIAVSHLNIENDSRRAELIEIAVADGAEQTIKTPDWNEIDDVSWLADGSGLFVTAKESPTAPYQVWYLSYPNGEARKITNDLLDYGWLSVSADGRKIVAEQVIGNQDIWLLEDNREAKQLTFGSATDNGGFGLAFAPEGKIIYTSPRSGNMDLWQTNADGGGQKQLTANAGTYNGKPMLTPDGRYIVFTSNRSGANKIWRMEASGVNPARLTNDENIEERQPFIAPDGAWIFYTKTEGENFSIWKVAIEGGTPVRVSEKNNIATPIVSPDGALIAYQFYEKGAAQPWKTGIINAADSTTRQTLDIPAARGLLAWTGDSKNLIYTDSYSVNLWQQPLDGGARRQITDFKSERIFNFTVSRDGKRILTSRGNKSTEAVLISGF